MTSCFALGRRPAGQRPGFGDHTTAMNLAFGIAAALFRRERGGEPSVVDVSLLGTAMWVLSSDVVYSANPAYDPHITFKMAAMNPLTATYRTSDDRFIALVKLNPFFSIEVMRILADRLRRETQFGS